jgi:photosystem II stability/assembly factor-like uncharacterized protein
MKKYMKQTTILLILCSTVLLSCFKDPPAELPPALVLSADSLKLLQTDIPDDVYNDMTFLKDKIGFAISRNGKIVKTKDGGYHWSVFSPGVDFYLNRIQFINNEIGFVVGGDSTGGYLLKTPDAGATWQLINLHMPEPGWPTGLFFVDANKGFITGKKFFKKTTDGGTTWVDAINTATENFSDVSFKTSSTGFATASAGRYYKTDDAGNTWQMQQSEVSQTLNEICHATSNSFAISGTNLINLQTGKAVQEMTLPQGIRRLLFLNDISYIGIGQHYEAGFWPYGDILVANKGWITVRKTYNPASEALDFTAIAKRADGHILMLGTGLLATPIVALNY